jgi:hypothetical protein
MGHTKAAQALSARGAAAGRAPPLTERLTRPTQVLSLLALLVQKYQYWRCSPSVSRDRRRYSVYLLYWYKSTNTGAASTESGKLKHKQRLEELEYADVCVC